MKKSIIILLSLIFLVLLTTNVWAVTKGSRAMDFEKKQQESNRWNRVI